MIYAPGGYRFFDYTRVGAPLNLIFWLTAVLLIPRLWPF
jgi:di/tricarboxylate transporter